jgi:hypothetical protein
MDLKVTRNRQMVFHADITGAGSGGGDIKFSYVFVDPASGVEHVVEYDEDTITPGTLAVRVYGWKIDFMRVTFTSTAPHNGTLRVTGTTAE